MFVKLNENNEIIASADFKFAEDCIETNRTIVRNWDGRLVFDTEKTERPLDQFKLEKINELKKVRDNFKMENNYNYSYNDEYNIANLLGNHTIQDRTNYFSFLDKLIMQYNNYKQEIENASTKEELDSINITFHL